MKASELRLGNLVLRPKKKDGRKTSEFKEVVVESIDSVGINVWQSGYEGENDWEGEFDEDEVKPIPLTEEWLIKFGFYNTGAGWFKGLKNVHHDVIFHFQLLLIEGDFIFTVPGLPAKNIQFVHDLQNVYFAVTNEELTLK